MLVLVKFRTLHEHMAMCTKRCPLLCGQEGKKLLEWDFDFVTRGKAEVENINRTTTRFFFTITSRIIYALLWLNRDLVRFSVRGGICAWNPELFELCLALVIIPYYPFEYITTTTTHTTWWYSPPKGNKLNQCNAMKWNKIKCYVIK